MTTAPAIQAFFDEPTNTVSYLVSDPATRRAAVIDPVLDYDHRTGKARRSRQMPSSARRRPATSRSSGCWRRMPMPIICLGRPISS